MKIYLYSNQHPDDFGVILNAGRYAVTSQKQIIYPALDIIQDPDLFCGPVFEMSFIIFHDLRPYGTRPYSEFLFRQEMCGYTLVAYSSPMLEETTSNNSNAVTTNIAFSIRCLVVEITMVSANWGFTEPPE